MNILASPWTHLLFYSFVPPTLPPERLTLANLCSRHLGAPDCGKSENELKNQLMASEYRCCCHSQGFSAEAQRVEEQSGLSTAGYSGPLDQYSGLIRGGSLREDEHQKAVLQKLDQLHKTLRGYSNTPTSIFSKVEPTSSSSQHLNIELFSGKKISQYSSATGHLW